VVAHEVEAQRRDGGAVRDREALAEVSGDRARAARRALGDDRCFVAVAVAELGEAALPAAIVVLGCDPARLERAAVVEVAPQSAARHAIARPGVHARAGRITALLRAGIAVVAELGAAGLEA